MSEQLTSKFYRPFNLEDERKQRHPLSRDPVAHQKKALDKLHVWFKNKHVPHAGGILVFPTGGGKTFAASHFLCDGPLSKGYKVLWLAHTHHLLEQAFFSFETEVWHIPGTRPSLNVRVVSGTEGHFRVHQIATTDDILIATLQTMVNAQRRSHPQLEAWLKQASDKLFVVFDEAHHSPASTYRKLIMELRQRHSEMYVLGLTATPDYMDERKSGWLKELFPQEIIDQVSPEELMAVEILAKPIPEQHRTKFSTEFDAKKYHEWVGKNRDIPEEIITKLAESEERNEFIARTYLERRRQQQPYGKTIIFTDRWFQCERLKGLLAKEGVRVDVMFSQTDINPGSVAARNKRIRDENAQVLERFRRNELDVLINVKMLTEGTDVPDVQT
ncbi:MAG TPA: DEAD/DEAH box helicase family protein, partial [Anaerolineae bacterium]|nr:DEAD/DEAH box helicase family protein [Anaerolineae bacterium]